MTTHERDTLEDRFASYREPRCAACDYDLRGNPDVIQCNECGYAYEPGQLLFRPYVNNSLISRVYRIFEKYFLFIIPALWLYLAYTGRANSIEATLHCIGAIIILMQLLWMLIKDKSEEGLEYLVIDTEGVRWGLHGLYEVKCQWEKHKVIIHTRFFRRRVKLVHKWGQKIEIPTKFIPQTITLDEFYHKLESCWQAAHRQTENDDASAN